jgi:hypothetical protein
MPIVDASQVTFDTPQSKGRILDASTVKFDDAPPPSVIPRSLGQRLREVPGNIIPSATNFAVNTVRGLDPRNGKALGDIAAGGVEKGLDMIIGKKAGTGKEEPAFDAFVTGMKDRYGGWENVKKTMAEDPVGFLADISSVFSGGAGIAEKAGIESAAAAARTGASFTNPVSLATKPIAAGANRIAATKAPEWLMTKAMKMPPGSLRDEVRQDVASTMSRGDIPSLGSKTLPAMNARMKGLETHIDNTLDNLSRQGAEFSIDKVSKALEDMKKEYVNRPDSQDYYRAIDEAKKSVIEHDFAARKAQVTVNAPTSIVGPNGQPLTVPQQKTVSVPDTISLMDANQLKKGIYQEIQSYYARGQKPETGRVGMNADTEAAYTKAKARAASVLRNEVLNHPDVPKSVRQAMRTEAGLMNARKWVERALNRGGNLDPISLSGMLFGVLVEKGVPGAVAYKIATTQASMSRLAKWAGKEGRAGISAARPNALYQVGKAGASKPYFNVGEGATSEQVPSGAGSTP